MVTSRNSKGLFDSDPDEMLHFSACCVEATQCESGHHVFWSDKVLPLAKTLPAGNLLSLFNRAVSVFDHYGILDYFISGRKWCNHVSSLVKMRPLLLHTELKVSDKLHLTRPSTQQFKGGGEGVSLCENFS